jgi:hypothetical protein
MQVVVLCVGRSAPTPRPTHTHTHTHTHTYIHTHTHTRDIVGTLIHTTTLTLDTLSPLRPHLWLFSPLTTSGCHPTGCCVCLRSSDETQLPTVTSRPTAATALCLPPPQGHRHTQRVLIAPEPRVSARSISLRCATCRRTFAVFSPIGCLVLTCTKCTRITVTACQRSARCTSWALFQASGVFGPQHWSCAARPWRAFTVPAVFPARAHDQRTCLHMHARS